MANMDPTTLTSRPRTRMERITITVMHIDAMQRSERSRALVEVTFLVTMKPE